MECVLCHSPRIMKFIDGFGERRIFCKWCGRSFLEYVFDRMNDQKRLMEFNH